MLEYCCTIVRAVPLHQEKPADPHHLKAQLVAVGSVCGAVPGSRPGRPVRATTAEALQRAASDRPPYAGPAAPAHRRPRGAACRAIARSPTKTSLVSRSFKRSPRSRSSLENNRQYRRKSLIAQDYLAIARNPFSFCNNIRRNQPYLAADSTTGLEKPLGSRGAKMADTLGVSR